jgi:hypothetical protein
MIFSRRGGYDGRKESGMCWYEIQYVVNGKKYSTVVRPPEIRPEQYHEHVLDVVESLVVGGAVVVDLREVVC